MKHWLIDIFIVVYVMYWWIVLIRLATYLELVSQIKQFAKEQVGYDEVLAGIYVFGVIISLPFWSEKMLIKKANNLKWGNRRRMR